MTNAPKITFEEFMREQHAIDYHGIDDDMVDDYESWCQRLDVQEVWDYAETLVAELQAELPQNEPN